MMFAAEVVTQSTIVQWGIIIGAICLTVQVGLKLIETLSQGKAAVRLKELDIQLKQMAADEAKRDEERAERERQTAAKVEALRIQRQEDARRVEQVKTTLEENTKHGDENARLIRATLDEHTAYLERAQAANDGNHRKLLKEIARLLRREAGRADALPEAAEAADYAEKNLRDHDATQAALPLMSTDSLKEYIARKEGPPIPATARLIADLEVKKSEAVKEYADSQRPEDETGKTAGE